MKFLSPCSDPCIIVYWCSKCFIFHLKIPDDMEARESAETVLSCFALNIGIFDYVHTVAWILKVKGAVHPLSFMSTTYVLLLNLGVLFVMFKLISQISVLRYFASMKSILIFLYGHNPNICICLDYWQMLRLFFKCSYPDFRSHILSLFNVDFNCLLSSFLYDSNPQTKWINT